MVEPHTRRNSGTPVSPRRDQADVGVRAIAILACLFAAALVLIGTTIYFGSVRQDATQRANEERIVRASLAILERSIGDNLVDYTRWDDAVQHLAIAFDPAWAKRNIGPNINATLGYQITLLLDPENRPIYGQADGDEGADQAARLLGPAAAALADQARAGDPPTDRATIGVITGPEGELAAAASSIVAEEGSNLVAPPGKPFVLVFAKKLDTNFLASFRADFGLAPLAIIGTDQPAGDRANVELVDPTGATEARIAWTPWQPGRHQLNWLIPAFLGTLLSIVIFASLAMQGTRLARALRASEARLRDFAQASSDWWWETDSLGRFVWFSRGFAQSADVDPDQLLGHTRREVAEVVTGDPLWEAHDADLEAHRPFRDFTYTLRKSVDRPRTMRSSGRPIFGSDGAFRGYRGTGRDVTEEWAAAQRLRESEQRFRSLVENLHGIIFCHGVAGDGPHGYDADGVHVFGTEAAKLVGTVDERQRAKIANWYEAIHQDDLPAYLAVERRRKEEGTPYTVEYRIRHPVSGAERWVREVAWRVDAREDMRRHLYSYIIDITDEKKAALALQESEVRLQLALASGGMGTWDVDLKTGAERWNDVHYQLFGVDPAHFTPSSESFMALVDPRDRDGIQAIADEVLSGRAAPDFTNDYRVVLSDGKTRWIGGGGRLLRDAAGRPERLLGVSFDITERKERELALGEAHARLAEQTQLLEARNHDLEAANQAKSRFVASVSHEIRTPMNAVLGFADLLAGSPLTEAQHRYVDVIQDTGRHLLTILNDILDIAKLEAGRLDLEHIDFALAACLEQVRSLLAPQASERGLELVVNQITRNSLVICGDPTRLSQILVNLVGNGLKFTTSGGVTLSVREQVRSDLSVLLRFEVRDTGIGIPLHRQAELFQAFVQGDSTTTRHYGGSGLGLVICKSLVLAMGGTIGLESEPGQGSLFWFEVPFELGDAMVVAEAREFAPEQIRALRILVADDVAPNRELLGEMLGRYGHDVLFAEDGAVTVAMAARERLDVVLMDVQMPIMDGIEATRRIRRLTPPMNAVPIFALTANVMAAERERCLAAGMNLCLSKPVVWPDLFAALAGVANPGDARGNRVDQDVAATSHPTPAWHDVPLVDTELLHGLARNVPASAFQSLVGRGLAGAQDSCRRLRSALADPARVAEEAHRLRGTAGTFGLARISALAEEIERVSVDMAAASELVLELESAVAATEAAIGALKL